MSKPIVILPACTRKIGHHAQHGVQFKYVDAVVDGAGCAPLILPALGARTDVEAVLATCHGILLTGSPSNVHPGHYAQAVLDDTLPRDPARDATIFPLIRAALDDGVPLLAICRGFQEINVALGGSLHQAVHGVAGLHDHREDKDASLDQQYAPAHAVAIEAGGKLERILQGGGSALLARSMPAQSQPARSLPIQSVPTGSVPTHSLQVNSLHGQGIDRLADGLVVEARAADGLVEAYSVRDAPGFTLAVQWHPEWRVTEYPASLRIFQAFGQACRDRQRTRGRP
jgi:putative glutamine amidotransferase